jgi:hypothetical protein
LSFFAIIVFYQCLLYQSWALLTSIDFAGSIKDYKRNREI